MYCYLCHGDLGGAYREEYEITFGARAHVACLDRAAREFGPAWRTIASPGCYAGGRPDPHLFNLVSVRQVSLTDILATYTEAMGGAPVAQPITEFGSLPPFAAFGQVVYSRHVPEGTVLLYGGRKAGRSTIVYKDAYAHWEHRFRLAMEKPLEEIDARFDRIAHDMHHRLDRLAREIERDIEATDPRYILRADQLGVYLVNLPGHAWRYLGDKD
jgi:hypothetical protein